MRLSNSSHPYTEADQSTLIDVAALSIWHGLDAGEPLAVNLREYPDALQQRRACFVTLRIEDRLRGCMGSLKPKRPLVEDVAHNAFAAAMRDPRFPRLEFAEYGRLHIHLSILSEVNPIAFNSQAELFEEIRPGIDGLLLQSEGRSGTLLPAVWSHVNGIEEFWGHLLKKAGLPDDYWNEDLSVSRYTTHSFGSESVG